MVNIQDKLNTVADKCYKEFLKESKIEHGAHFEFYVGNYLYKLRWFSHYYRFINWLVNYFSLIYPFTNQLRKIIENEASMRLIRFERKNFITHTKREHKVNFQTLVSTTYNYSLRAIALRLELMQQLPDESRYQS